MEYKIDAAKSFAKENNIKWYASEENEKIRDEWISRQPLAEEMKEILEKVRHDPTAPEMEVFDRAEKSHLELEDDTECIANCVLKSKEPKTINSGYIFSYRFPDQNYKLKKGSSVFDVITGN